jgi:hypothetical protein
MNKLYSKCDYSPAVSNEEYWGDKYEKEAIEKGVKSQPLAKIKGVDSGPAVETQTKWYE